MYYKVMKNNKVIDVLDNLVYLKWQEKHRIMVVTEEKYAQAIMSSDQKYIWHVDGMYDVPVEKFDTVTLEPIDIYEYNELKILNCRTVSEILDEYTLFLLESGVL